MKDIQNLYLPDTNYKKVKRKKKRGVVLSEKAGCQFHIGKEFYIITKSQKKFSKKIKAKITRRHYFKSKENCIKVVIIWDII